MLIYLCSMESGQQRIELARKRSNNRNTLNLETPKLVRIRPTYSALRKSLPSEMGIKMKHQIKKMLCTEQSFGRVANQYSINHLNDVVEDLKTF